MGIGKDYAKKHAQFIKFDEDGVIEGRFEGMKIVVKDSFGEEKEVIRYKIGGKTFDSVSTSLAEKMDEVAKGNIVKITKTGEGMGTRYEVEVIDG